jgi:hypothetical protein
MTINVKIKVFGNKAAVVQKTNTSGQVVQSEVVKDQGEKEFGITGTEELSVKEQQ